MKVKMSLKTLVDAIEKGCIGALTKESNDEDRKKIRPTDSCVKILAKKEMVVFESSSPTISVLHSVVDNSILVEEEGCVCINASDYCGVLKTIKGDYDIKLSDEVNKEYSKDNINGVVQPNGKLITWVVNSKSEKRKGKNDTYPIDEFAKVDYATKEPILRISTKTLKDAVGNVTFATDSTDLGNVLDKIAILVTEDNKTYFGATDGKRCAIFLANDGVSEIKANNQKILINAEILKMVGNAFEDNDIIEMYYCKDVDHEKRNCVLFVCGNTHVRVSTASEEVKQQFPNFMGILKIEMPKTAVMNKSDLSSAIEFLSKYNSEKSVLHIKEGSEVKICAARRGDDPESATVECDPFQKSLDNPVAISNPFVKDVIKKIDGDKIQFSFSQDEKKIKITSLKDSNFVYLMQCMVNN